MEVTNESRQQFIIDTLVPFLNKERPFGYQGAACVYLQTETKACCAVGMHMQPGPWQEHIGEALSVFANWKQDDVLTEEAAAMEFEPWFWNKIQSVHDIAALKANGNAHGTAEQLSSAILALLNLYKEVYSEDLKLLTEAFEPWT